MAVSSGDKYYIDHEEVARVETFFGTCLYYKGEPIKILPWYRRFITEFFGTKKTSDGLRRYRYAYVQMPRGNSKSFFCAGIALYSLLTGGPNSEVYSAAGDRAQASITLANARGFVQAHDARNGISAKKYLADCLKPYRSEIRYGGQNSFWRVLSSEGKNAHGGTPYAVIFDEVWTQSNDVLWEAFESGLIKRPDSFIISITTPGYDRESLAYRQYTKAKAVLENPAIDESFYPLIYESDPEDDIGKEATWQKANPGYGLILSAEDFKRSAARAKNEPAYENTFRRFNLGQWTQQATRFIPYARWDNCKGGSPADALRGQACWAGLDLAPVNDISALLLLFRSDDGTYDLIPHFWLPADTVEDKERRDGVPYAQWVREGYMEATEGNTTDFNYVYRRIKELHSIYPFKVLAYDQSHAHQLAQQLKEDDGIETVNLPQTWGQLSPPTRELERLLIAQRLRHPDHPVLNWMAGNVEVRTGQKGDVMISKAHYNKRVDGIAALIFAISRAMAEQPEDATSIYEKQDIFVF